MAGRNRNMPLWNEGVTPACLADPEGPRRVPGRERSQPFRNGNGKRRVGSLQRRAGKRAGLGPCGTSISRSKHGLHSWRSCSISTSRYARAPGNNGLAAAPAQVRSAAPLRHSRRAVARLAFALLHSLRQVPVPLPRRGRPSGLVADLHGRGPKTCRAYPGGTGRGSASPSRGGPPVSAGCAGSARDQCPATGFGEKTGPPEKAGQTATRTAEEQEIPLTVNGPSPGRLWKYVVKQLCLQRYLDRLGDGRWRPATPAPTLLWALLPGPWLRTGSFHGAKALVRSRARRHRSAWRCG